MLVSALPIWYKLVLSGKRTSIEEKKCHHQIGLEEQGGSIFLMNDSWERPRPRPRPSLLQQHCGPVSLGCIKTKLNRHGDAASKRCSSTVSASVPALRFPPWVPAQISLHEGVWATSWYKPAPLQVVSGHGVYHSNRKESKAVVYLLQSPSFCALQH